MESVMNISAWGKYIVDFLSLPLIGSILGILGIITGVIFYSLSKIVSKPYYSIYTSNIIEVSKLEEADKIKLFYNDTQINQLNKTVVIFGNDGNKTIDRTDLVPEYLELDFSENDKSTFHIFKIEKETSRKSINVDIKEDKQKVGFSFNYLDKKDSIWLSIYHTGKYNPVQVIGDVKGVHGIKSRDLRIIYADTLVDAVSVSLEMIDNSAGTGGLIFELFKDIADKIIKVLCGVVDTFIVLFIRRKR